MDQCTCNEISMIWTSMIYEFFKGLKLQPYKHLLCMFHRSFMDVTPTTQALSHLCIAITDILL